MCNRMRPCPTLEYAAVLLVVVGLIAAVWGLGRAVSEPLRTAEQALTAEGSGRPVTKGGTK